MITVKSRKKVLLITLVNNPKYNNFINLGIEQGQNTLKSTIKINIVPRFEVIISNKGYWEIMIC